MRVFDIGGPTVPYDASDRVLTVPNLLSLLRLAALPLVHLDLIAGRFGRAFVLLVVLTSTDWLDGYVARRFDQRTRLGALLDPLGDRALFLVVGIGLVRSALLPLWVLVVLLAREAVVLLAGVVLVASGRQVPPTSRLGKVATAGLMISLPALILAAALGDGGSAPLGWLRDLAWVGILVNLALTYVATAGYVGALRGRHR
jgi:cardiolipin synthase (CMP-forming)